MIVAIYSAARLPPSNRTLATLKVMTWDMRNHQSRRTHLNIGLVIMSFLLFKVTWTELPFIFAQYCHVPDPAVRLGNFPGNVPF